MAGIWDSVIIIIGAGITALVLVVVLDGATLTMEADGDIRIMAVDGDIPTTAIITETFLVQVTPELFHLITETLVRQEVVVFQ